MLPPYRSPTVDSRERLLAPHESRESRTSGSRGVSRITWDRESEHSLDGSAARHSNFTDERNLSSSRRTGPGATGVPWRVISAVITANMLGIGVLSLPFAASVLGWIPFGVCLVLAAVGAQCSGQLFSLLYLDALARDCDWRVMADAGLDAYGTSGQRLVRGVAYFYMGGVVVIIHLTATTAVATVFRELGECDVVWSAAVGCVALAALQVRQMRHIGALALLGVVTIVVPCTLTLWSVVIEHPEPAPTEWFGTNATLLQKGVAAFDVVFAYAGQVIFIELQSDMHTPADFPAAVGSSLGAMTACYAAVACTAYYYLGTAGLADGRPITSHLRGPLAARVRPIGVAMIAESERLWRRPYLEHVSDTKFVARERARRVWATGA